ncbi:hypothetical protein ISN44_As05g028170 [Arabidopsis suecica]|uniref:Uncharacterized protein n=1 Tax=Arabidopsis suecica TaxID=45249 RepID=A0A8T2DGX6_ARASU|nr:hypothetical protein ISN44_As05g028170 [Arabidopsis suecica]
MEPKIAATSVKTPEPVVIPPEVPLSTNTETVTIEDDDDSEPRDGKRKSFHRLSSRPRQPTVPVRRRLRASRRSLFLTPLFIFHRKIRRRRTTLWTRSSTSIAACAMRGSSWASKGKRSRPEWVVCKGK